jgi:purine nucleosidase
MLLLFAEHLPEGLRVGEVPDMEADAFNQHHVFVDTGIGDDIDDALALTVIINSPEIALQGMSTVFGDTMQRARLAA